jgi:hypothetical protein
MKTRKVLIGLTVINFVLLVLLLITQIRSVAAQDVAPVIRARGIIIVDDQGRERIAIGSPVPDPREGRRRSPSTGLVINDAAGYERFGVALSDDGFMGMGFDAPPLTGQPGNRERINIVSDPRGGAEMRFLNRKTFVPGRLIVDDDDQFYLELQDFPQGKVVSRRISFTGEQTVERDR